MLSHDGFAHIERQRGRGAGEKEGRGGRGERLVREEGGRKGRTRESFPVPMHLVTRVVCVYIVLFDHKRYLWWLLYSWQPDGVCVQLHQYKVAY